MSNGYKLGVPSALLLLLGFFLPWIAVSCNGRELLEASGTDIAFGPTVGSGFLSTQVDGRPLFFMIPIAAILVLLFAFLAFQRRDLQSQDRTGVIVAGLVPFLVMLFEMSRARSEFEVESGFDFGLNIDVDIGLGFWCTLIGAIGIVIAGIMNWRSRSEKLLTTV